MGSTVVPLHDRLVVRRLPEPVAPPYVFASDSSYAIEDVKPGEVRLITPDCAIQRSRYGEVVAVGPGGRNKAGDLVPLSVTVGERVWIGRMTDWDTFRTWEEDCSLIQEADIVAVERGDDLCALSDRVILKLDPFEDGEGLIITPDVFQKKPDTGVVVSVGPGRRLADGTTVPNQAQVGDHIAFDRELVQECTLRGREMLVLRDGDVLAVLPVAEVAA